MRNILLLILIFSVGLNIYAQEKSPIETYKEIFGNNDSALQVGRLYNSYYPAIGHQFYQESLPEKGSIILNNILIDSVLINFDVYKGLLVYYRVNANNSMTPLIPNQSFIDGFTMNDVTFINSRMISNKLPVGYYNVLFQKKNVHLVLMPKKVLNLNQDPISPKKFIFKEENQLSIVIGNEVIEVQRKNKLKKELKKLDPLFDSIFNKNPIKKKTIIYDLTKILQVYANQ